MPAQGVGTAARARLARKDRTRPIALSITRGRRWRPRTCLLTIAPIQRFMLKNVLVGPVPASHRGLCGLKDGKNVKKFAAR